jgi:hypothetical protein
VGRLLPYRPEWWGRCLGQQRLTRHLRGSSVSEPEMKQRDARAPSQLPSPLRGGKSRPSMSAWTNVTHLLKSYHKVDA